MERYLQIGFFPYWLGSNFFPKTGQEHLWNSDIFCWLEDPLFSCFDTVLGVFLTQQYAEFSPQTIWSLTNAFKALDAVLQFKVAVKMEEFLSQLPA